MNDERPIKMPNFILSLKSKKSIHRMTDEEAGQLLKLLFDYADDETFQPDESKYNNSVLMMYDSIIPTIDENREKYVRKVERNRKNSKNAGAPVGNQNAKKTIQNNPVDCNSIHWIEKTIQNNPVGTNKTKVNKTKQNVSVSYDTDTYSTKASPSVCPEGQPPSKPEYRELRVFAREVLKLDNAYFCDDFVSEIENQGGDWSDWQAKMTAFAEEHKNEWSYDG